jgi:competence protein ComEA
VLRTRGSRRRDVYARLRALFASPDPDGSAASIKVRSVGDPLIADPPTVVRLDPGRTGSRVVAGALIVGLAFAAHAYWTGRTTTTTLTIAGGVPVSTPASSSTTAGSLPASSSPLSSSPASSLSTTSPVPGASASSVVVVYVVGPVRHPGVFTLPAGSRAIDALRSAGGVRPGHQLGPVNLAAPLVDGSRVDFGTGEGTDTSAGGGGSASTGSASGAGGSGLVDLNKATLTELDGLPGVGPVLAQRILDWRSEHGRFTSVDELREVAGIGARKFESIRSHVRV